MKNDLTTITRQDDIWCPINIILLCTSDVTIESHANLQEIYTVLCKSVYDIHVKLATNDTIFGIDENQFVIDTTIAENRDTSAVTTIDDIEFWDWAGKTQSQVSLVLQWYKQVTNA